MHFAGFAARTSLNQDTVTASRSTKKQMASAKLDDTKQGEAPAIANKFIQSNMAYLLELVSNLENVQHKVTHLKQ